MYSLMTLEKDSFALRAERAKNVEQFRQFGNHQIKPLDTKKRGFYTAQLRNLIRQCLNPDPAKRPPQLELMDQTRRGLQMALKRARRARKPTRVYFRGHEINDMPLGDAGFTGGKEEVKRLVTDEFVNPDLPRLKIPRKKYADVPDHLLNPGWKKMYDKTNSHRRWFKPVGAPPDPPKDDGEDDDDESDFNPGGGGTNGDYQAPIFHLPLSSRQTNKHSDNEDEEEEDEGKSSDGENEQIDIDDDEEDDGNNKAEDENEDEDDEDEDDYDDLSP